MKEDCTGSQDPRRTGVLEKMKIKKKYVYIYIYIYIYVYNTFIDDQ
jgi:hypothetical protein